MPVSEEALALRFRARTLPSGARELAVPRGMLVAWSLATLAALVFAVTPLTMLPRLAERYRDGRSVSQYGLLCAFFFLVGAVALWFVLPRLLFRVILHVDPSGIVVRCGWRRWKFEAGDIESVDCRVTHPHRTPGDISIGKKPAVHSCRVESRTGASIDFGDGLGEEELEWLTRQIRSLVGMAPDRLK